MNPIVSMNSSTGIPFSTVTFLKACSDRSCFAGVVCPVAGAVFSMHTAIVASAPSAGNLNPLLLLFVVVTHSAERPPLPELTLNRIDTVFFPHVPVGRPIRSLTPQTLLDLLRAVHQLQLQLS